MSRPKSKCSLGIHFLVLQWSLSLSTSLFLSLNFFRSLIKEDLPIYSYLDCITVFYLKGYWFFFKYLSHHCLDGNGIVGCKLWEHCSGVILPLMRHVELVYCIECGGDECFIWKFPPTLTRTSLLSSSDINLMALSTCFQSPKKYPFLGLLGRVVLLDFLDLIALTELCLIWWIVGSSYTLGGSHLMIPYLRASSVRISALKSYCMMLCMTLCMS